MAELTKLAISLALVFFNDAKHRMQTNSPTDFETATAFAASPWRSQWQAFLGVLHEQNLAHPGDTFKLVVPAALYTLQNNLVYVALANLEATTFQVGYQMKVITTAVLSVMMLGRTLSSSRWVALVLLTSGIVLTQVGGKGGDANKTEQNFTLGLAAVVVCGFSSAFAGVYFEKILKGSAPSVWMRNAQLAFFSTLCGVGGMLAKDGLLLGAAFFQGYNSWTWSLILVQAAGGLIVAVVVKYADNILKGFAAAFSIVMCGLCSMVLFGFTPSPMFVLGSLVVIIATILYAMPEAVKASDKGKPDEKPSPVSSVPFTPTVKV
jgi:UDP-sugar transporter A1/2/3